MRFAALRAAVPTGGRRSKPFARFFIVAMCGFRCRARFTRVGWARLSRLVLQVGVAEGGLLDLAGGGAGNRVHEDDLAGALVAGQLVRAVRDQASAVTSADRTT